MNKIEFNIFRLKINKNAQTFPTQPSLFEEEEIDRKDLIIRVVEEKQSIELRRGNVWHIGNIKLFDKYKGYFAVGRTTKTINEKYDKYKGDFMEELYETSPYTHVFFDAEIGVIAVGKKAKLSPTVESIAQRIEALFNNSNLIKSRLCTVVVSYIPDPQDFLSSLRSAYAIKSFTLSFTRPNPFDADEYFQKPMEKLLQESDGEKGNATLVGEALKADPLVELSKSAAATGNDAKALIQLQHGKRPVRKRMKGNPAKFTVAEEFATEYGVLNIALQLYHEIRGDQQ